MSIKYPLKDPYTFTIDEIVDLFQTDMIKGISKSEAEKRSNEFGLNVYQVKKHKSIWIILLQQFKSPIVYLLIFGATVSLYFQDYLEAIAITIVILINALIGFLMELQARNSMKALLEMDIILSKVIRDGKTEEIPSENLVPGDLVILEAGDVIPGDGRIVELNQLQCDESSLTGESLPTDKNTEKLPKNTVIGDQFNMVFKGASVINGNGKAIIIGISENTQLGIITSLVDSTSETVTPLDKKLNSLGTKLIWLTLSLTFVFAITGILQGKEWMLIIKTAIALAVAAFPEGLPIVSTVALAYGMLLMAKRNAIVKKLSSVETLGSTNVILTDKTGTLTENKIYVDTFSFPEEIIKVNIEKNELHFTNGQIEKSIENFEKLKLVGSLCNNAIEKTTKGKKKFIGDPIEIALVNLTTASGENVEKLKKQYARIAEAAFNSETKIMGTLHKNKKGYFVAAKGSVEHLLKKCNEIQFGATQKKLTQKERNAVLATSEKMAAEGLRVLAFAYREETKINKEDYLNDLVFLGTIGFLDPPRLDIKPAIESCREAGIKVVMITGDHPLTALNIAKKTGLIDDEEQTVITGKELSNMHSLTKVWKKKILSTAIFARTTPKQKLEIAAIFQKEGNIVAMTGDGVNDAPALKQADIGIAMGIRGTQVAKEAASIILKDDSFKSITAAVSQGRAIFQNIQRFVIYLVSCNLSEIFIVTVLGIFAPASTLLPLQILFLNMITDVFPALALGLGKGDNMVMKNPPRDPKESIISNKNWLIIALYSSAITLAVFVAVWYCRYAITTDEKIVNNIAFITLAFAQLFHVFNMSSVHSKLFINEITTNKFVWMALFICTGLLLFVYVVPQLRLVLNLTLITGEIWMVAILASILPVLTVHIYKSIRKLTIQN
ncbi:cation-translocating P-type ATPase [Flavobacterium sp. LB1P71]|uniref:cation-translocating P-type ATPase n=1 Tax=unclassified Flavobacterium TaxID=196869 RepID=UPI003AAC630B